jgi:cysteine desulfurase/selenocysteine lyase
VAGVLRDEIGRIPGVRMYGPDDESKRTSIVTFMTPADSSTIVKKLEQNSMIFAARDVGGKKAVRASPHFFNSEEEAATTASYVKSIL